MSKKIPLFLNGEFVESRSNQYLPVVDTAKELTPHAAKWDREKIFPRDAIRKAGEMGFCGVYIDENVGGLGLSRSDACDPLSVQEGKYVIDCCRRERSAWNRHAKLSKYVEFINRPNDQRSPSNLEKMETRRSHFLRIFAGGW